MNYLTTLCTAWTEFSGRTKYCLEQINLFGTNKYRFTNKFSDKIKY